MLLLGFVLQWHAFEIVCIQLLGIVEWIRLGAGGSVLECYLVHVLVLPAHFPLGGIGDALVGLTIVLLQNILDSATYFIFTKTGYGRPDPKK